MERDEVHRSSRGWRLNRRRALRGAIAGTAAIGGVSLLACRGQERPVAAPDAPAVKQPKRGGVLSHSGGGAGSSDTQGYPFDPHLVNLPQGIVYRLFYQGLLGHHPQNYEVEPELAQRWEQPASTEYVFRLQPGVKWHNKPPASGRELTADDIVFSLNRARTNEPRFLSRSLLDTVDRIEAIDKGTVRITTQRPDAVTLFKLSADTLLVLAPEVVERAGRFATVDTAVGTGAFIARAIEQNVGAEYVRNPDYWKPGLPYLDAVRTRHLEDDQLGFAAFRAGELDICRVPGIESKAYINQQGPGYTAAWFRDDGANAFQPNTRRKPLDDRRVVRALRLLIDAHEARTAWAEVWFGRGRHGSMFPTALEEWDLSEEEYERHIFWKRPKDEAIREAISLLGAAGFNRENPLKFELGSQEPEYQVAINQLVQAQWKQLSQGLIDVQYKRYESAPFQNVRAQGQFDALLAGGLAGLPDPDVYLTQNYRTGGSRNYTGAGDPQLDAMIERQRVIFDLRERRAAVREIINFQINNGVVAIPSNRYFLNAVKPSVQNYLPEFQMNGYQYERVWLDS